MEITKFWQFMCLNERKFEKDPFSTIQSCLGNVKSRGDHLVLTDFKVVRRVGYSRLPEVVPRVTNIDLSVLCDITEQTEMQNVDETDEERYGKLLKLLYR
jgi:hypothetical protein